MSQFLAMIQQSKQATFPREKNSAIPDSEGATLDSEGDTPASNNTMPKMIDLETAGHRRSPRIAALPSKKYSFNSILSTFCCFGLLVATAIMQPITVFLHGQACLQAAVYQ